MRRLLDVNALIALIYEAHAHSALARRWLLQQHAETKIGVCRVAQMGALRITTLQSIWGSGAITPDDFWRLWDTLLTDTRFTFVAEPPNLDETWRALTLALPQGRKADTDTYLAAFAMASGASLVTFDKGFSRYEGLDLQLIAPA